METEICIFKYNETNLELASERLMGFQHFPHSAAHLSPLRPNCGGLAGRHKLQLIQNPQRQNRQKGVIYYPHRPRPASPPSLLSLPLLDPSLAVTVKRKLWGRHGALCHRWPHSTSPRPGGGLGLIGGSTREPSSLQAAQLGGPHLQACDLSAREGRRRRGGGRGRRWVERTWEK